MKRLKGFLLVNLLLLFIVGIEVQAKEPDIMTYDYITKETIIEKADEVSPTTFRGVMIEPEYNVGRREASPDVIIGGSDNRTKVNPNNSPYCRVICLRPGFDTDGNGTIDQWSYGTGFMTGNDVLVTAGHVVWHTNAKIQPKELRIYLKQTGSTLNTKYYFPQRWTLNTAFTNNNDSNYDWCVLELQQNLGTQTGYFGYGTGFSGSMSVALSGYPLALTYNQYTASGTMTRTSSFKFSHKVDATGGQSGSPVYNPNDGVVWGIHTSGSTPADTNYGCLITQNVYDLMNRYKYN